MIATTPAAKTAEAGIAGTVFAMAIALGCRSGSDLYSTRFMANPSGMSAGWQKSDDAVITEYHRTALYKGQYAMKKTWTKIPKFSPRGNRKIPQSTPLPSEPARSLETPCRESCAKA